ncbi:MAG: signal recognition particle-docking protein FtsY [Bacteroidia bacterium]|jgi:fused signal recognition particle receptor
MAFFNLFGKKNPEPEDKSKLDAAVQKTRENLLGRIGRAFLGKRSIDEDFLDELEEILITGDVGVETTIAVIGRLKEAASRQPYLNEGELQELIRQEVAGMMPVADAMAMASGKPYIIMVVGVNGVGKTTTIGKLAHRFTADGLKVLLGAGDTFRAAAVDQLGTWAQRSGCDMVSLGMGADPASVAHDAVKKGVEGGYDVVIVDTAGRLHNKVGLMNELAKVKRVMQKFREDAPHEVLLVLDASTGQNAYEQAKEFTQATQVNALALTKLDGTARGGVVLGISHRFGVPVKYLGVGEGIDDLRPFDAREFVDALFGQKA